MKCCHHLADLYLGARGVEPRTYALEGRCSIQLSYTPRYKSSLQSADISTFQWIEELLGERWKVLPAAEKNGRGREIRTPDILLPKQARYQTALYPDSLHQLRCSSERIILIKKIVVKLLRRFLWDIARIWP